MAKKSKIEGDFYQTPPWVTMCLMQAHKFDGDIWEPACGDGRMSEALKGEYKVLSTDLYDRGYAMDCSADFLCCGSGIKWPDNIVTNPPFSIATPFIMKALELARREIAFLLPTTFLNTKARGDFLEKNPPSKIIYLKDRIDFQNKGAPDVTCTYVWIIWNKQGHLSPKPFCWIGKNDLIGTA